MRIHRLTSILLHFQFFVLKIAFPVFFVLSFGWSTKTAQAEGLVKVEYPPDYQAPYPLRRSLMGFVFSGNAEQFYPTKFIFPVNGANYKTLFKDNNITLYQLEMGPQLNMILGSIDALLMYAQGSAKSVVETTTLKISKYGLKFNLNFDNLMKEPYIVPFVSFQTFQIQYSEYDPKENTGSPPVDEKKTTDWGTGYSVGLLFQLNFLDSDNFRQSLVSYGLDNTYLELFATQYNASSKKSDPNFETNFNYGLGLRLEF